MPDNSNSENKELQISGPIITDNLRIEAEKGIFYDVIVSPELVRQNFLNRTQVVSPEFTHQAEKILSNLTISFGSRPEEDVLFDIYSKQLGNTGKASLRAAFSTIQHGLQGGICGLTVYDPNYPLIYINTGNILKEYGVANGHSYALKEVWDHELFHLASELDPSKKTVDHLLSSGKETAAFFLSNTALFNLSLYVANRINVTGEGKFTRREFLKKAINFTGAIVVSTIPSYMIAKWVGSQLGKPYISKQDELAIENSLTNPTSDKEFYNMIQIKKSS